MGSSKHTLFVNTVLDVLPFSEINEGFNHCKTADDFRSELLEFVPYNTLSKLLTETRQRRQDVYPRRPERDASLTFGFSVNEVFQSLHLRQI